MIIGISGKAGSGKNTVANIIKDRANVKIYTVAFADELKKITGELLGIDIATIERYKREDIPIFGYPIRTWLQRIGTMFREEVNKSFWISRLGLRIEDIIKQDKDAIIIVTDLRYLNEALYLKNIGAKLVRVLRTTDIISNHPSETELDNEDIFDYILDNNSNIVDLKQEVEKMLIELQ